MRAIWLSMVLAAPGCAPDVWGWRVLPCDGVDVVIHGGTVWHDTASRCEARVRLSEGTEVEDGEQLVVRQSTDVRLKGAPRTLTVHSGAEGVVVAEGFAQGPPEPRDLTLGGAAIPSDHWEAGLSGAGTITLEDGLRRWSVLCDGCAVARAVTLEAGTEVTLEGADQAQLAGCSGDMVVRDVEGLVMEDCDRGGNLDAEVRGEVQASRVDLATIRLRAGELVGDLPAFQRLDLELTGRLASFDLEVPAKAESVSVATVDGPIRLWGLDVGGSYDLDVDTAGEAHTFLVDDAAAGADTALRAHSSTGAVVIQAGEGAPTWGSWVMQFPTCAEQTAQLGSRPEAIPEGWRFPFHTTSVLGSCLPFEENLDFTCELRGEVFDCDDQLDGGTEVTLSGRFVDVDEGELTYHRGDTTLTAGAFFFED